MINSDDYFITKENIKKLEDKSEKIYNSKYKLPTNKTYAMMKKDLLEFIKKKKKNYLWWLCYESINNKKR